MLPRFGWWFILEDLEMAPQVLRQTVSAIFQRLCRTRGALPLEEVEAGLAAF